MPTPAVAGTIVALETRTRGILFSVKGDKFFVESLSVSERYDSFLIVHQCKLTSLLNELQIQSLF